MKKIILPYDCVYFYTFALKISHPRNFSISRKLVRVHVSNVDRKAREKDRSKERILEELIRSIHRAYINGMHLSPNQIERVDANVLSRAISVLSVFPLESCHIHVYSNT